MKGGLRTSNHLLSVEQVALIVFINNVAVAGPKFSFLEI